jgi:conjugal transfer mating pair stabilization protein TraN
MQYLLSGFKYLSAYLGQILAYTLAIAASIIVPLASMLLISMLFNLQVLAAQNNYFQQGKNFGQGAKGMAAEPNDSFLQRGANTSHLQNMNDVSLSAAASSKTGSEESTILTQSHNKSTESIDKYQLNQDDAWIKNSMQVEANPMSAIGGSLTSSRSSVTSNISKICEEGTIFDIDIKRQLNYSPPVKHWGWGNWQPRQFSIMSNDTPQHWWHCNMHHFDYGDRWGHCLEKTINEAAHDDIAAYIVAREQIPDIKQVSVPRQNIFLTPLRDRMRNVDYLGQGFFATNVQVLFDYNFRERVVTSTTPEREEWIIVNPAQEEILENNSCYEVKRQCLDSGTKYFNKFHKVYRECWQEKISYQCKSQPEDGCKYLKDQNCMLQNSTCLSRPNGICMLWRREYLCKKNQERVNSSISGNNIYCLDGNCYTPELTENTDMHEAVSQLAILQEAQKQMQGNPPKVFQGQTMGCNKFMTGFNNCCSSMKGWGRSAGLHKCDQREKALAAQRDKGLCVRVGTYCAEWLKLVKTCIRKKTNFCCFGSKLARILHEQGRAQLGKGWGSAKSPDCKALTIDELSRIDFSKLNLSELFADIEAITNTSASKSFPKQMQNQMPKLQQNIDQQRVNAKQNGGSNVQESKF